MSQQDINREPIDPITPIDPIEQVENIETTESRDEFGLFAGSQSMIGRRINKRWVIVEVLGEGTMSTVYKAEEEATKKIVALKKIHQHLLKNVINLTKFEQRARALIALNHEHISNFYDIHITPEKEVFLFCDYFPSENLEEILSKVGHIDIERACKIFKQAASGLEYAHQQKILHRDLKPSNICIVNDQFSVDDVRIVDFGIARLLVEESQDAKGGRLVTQSREVFGSALYMSPEQAMGKKVDARSDIYAYGCVMYECINGKPPFVGKNVMETAYKHMNETPPPLVSNLMPPSRSFERYQAIVSKILQKQPERRYQTMGELRADLEMMLDANDNKWQTTAYCLKGFAKTSLRQLASEKVPWGIIASVLGVLLLFGIIAYWAFVLLTSGGESTTEYPHYDENRIWLVIDKKPKSIVEDFTTKRENARIELEAIEQEKGRSSKEYIKALNDLCTLFVQAGRWADAAVQLKQLIELQKTADPNANMSEAKSNMALSYFMQSQNEDAERISRETLDSEPNSKGNIGRKMTALNILGDIYNQRDDNKKALDVYLQLYGLTNANKFKDPVSYAKTCARLADTYRRMHDYKNAERYFLSGLDIWTNYKSHTGDYLAKLFFDYSLSLSADKQYLKSQQMLNRALPLAIAFEGQKSGLVGAIRKQYLENVYNIDFWQWAKLKLHPESDPFLKPPPVETQSPSSSTSNPLLP